MKSMGMGEQENRGAGEQLNNWAIEQLSRGTDDLGRSVSIPEDGYRLCLQICPNQNLQMMKNVGDFGQEELTGNTD